MCSAPDTRYNDITESMNDWVCILEQGHSSDHAYGYIEETADDFYTQVVELVNAAKLMCESLPVYAESSAAYTRKQRLDKAIEDTEYMLEYLRGEYGE